MTCKITYFYRDIVSSTDAGWTESFYSNAGSSEQAMQSAGAPGWVNERLAFLPSSYMLDAIRTQNVANRFDNTRRRYNQQTGAGQFPVGGRNQVEGEAPWQGVLVRLSAGTDVARSFILRGLTTDVVGENLEYQAPPRWDTAFRRWLGDLSVTPQAYQLRKMMLNQTYAPPTTLTVLADRRSLTLDFTPNLTPAGLVKGAVFFIDQVQNAAPMGGLWRVKSSGTNLVSTFPRRRLIYGTPDRGQAIRVMQFQYFAIDDFVIQRGAERRAGRPSDQLRGRARVRQT